jgi:hypothetical protein
VDWKLQLLPGAKIDGYFVGEASLSIPLDKTNRIIAGKLPDFQGYESYYPNADPTLGNQLISHNALFDLAGVSFYEGAGMSHALGSVALKWMVANIDSQLDTANYTAPDLATRQYGTRSTGVAARADWTIDEYSFLSLSVLVGNGQRNFSMWDIDGSYTHGDWAFNGQINVGTQAAAAYNGGDAHWAGVSGQVRYKVVPRLQLIARADYLQNSDNGGGTYTYSADNGSPSTVAGNSPYGFGIGPERDSAGAVIDSNSGANLTRLTLGTNYQINPNTQWKVEYRLDQSTGYNFLSADSVPTRTRNAFATSFVLSF